jgi:2,3-bisphosphoglycerate-dependent phosphoglycerate mutase
MNPTTEILIVRHCESTGQAPDAPLTEAGFAQARALVHTLARFPIDHVVSSPYRRAVQSIQPLAELRGLAIVEHVDLRERVLSAEPCADWLEHVERSFVDPEHALPTGESGRAVAVRAWAVLDTLIAQGHRLPVVVSHGNLIAFALNQIVPEIDFGFWQRMSNPDVFVIRRNREAVWSFERLLTPRRVGRRARS